MEMAIVAPLVIFMVFAIVQFGMWYHASQVANAAAQEGVTIARAVDGTSGDGHDRAERFLLAASPSLAQRSTITVDRNANTARVDVRSVAPSVIPGVRLAVHAQAESPIERFRSPQDQP